MRRTLFFILFLTLYFKGTSQIPSTKETIQSFIDSIGNSNDRQVITTSIFPAFANAIISNGDKISGAIRKRSYYG
jgi:hypothetical protein